MASTWRDASACSRARRANARYSGGSRLVIDASKHGRQRKGSGRRPYRPRLAAGQRVRRLEDQKEKPHPGSWRRGFPRVSAKSWHSPAVHQCSGNRFVPRIKKSPVMAGGAFCSIFEPHTFVVATQRAGGVFSCLLAPKISLAAAGGPMALGATGYRGFATCREPGYASLTAYFVESVSWITAHPKSPDHANAAHWIPEQKDN